jgi:hypothetical protein
MYVDALGQITEFRRDQLGGSVGGRIVRGRVFNFGDYEGLRQYQCANTSSIVPSILQQQTLRQSQGYR